MAFVPPHLRGQTGKTAGSATLDDRKIEEIVSRVVERIAGPTKAPPHGAQPAAAAAGPKSKPNIPRGTNGVYGDAEAAVTAARRGFEQNERTPIETRAK